MASSISTSFSTFSSAKRSSSAFCFFSNLPPVQVTGRRVERVSVLDARAAEVVPGKAPLYFVDLTPAEDQGVPAEITAERLKLSLLLNLGVAADEPAHAAEM